MKIRRRRGTEGNIFTNGANQQVNRFLFRMEFVFLLGGAHSRPREIFDK